MKFTAQQIADFLQGTVEGNPEATVSTFAKIEEGKADALSFLANTHYTHYIYDTASSIVLVNEDFVAERPVKATLVRVKNAYEAVARLLQVYEQSKPHRTGISPLASIAESATVGKECYIGPFAVIGEGVTIGRGTQIHAHVVVGDGVEVGEECLFYPHVSIYHGCRIGSRVTLHSGAVIGADGFGFAPTAEGYDKIPQIGIVVIEDDVEVGANTCVDRSTMSETIIRKGVKLDNLIQVAHNCEIGAHTVMSAQVGLAGSTKIGQWCMLGGQVGVGGHISVADGTQVGAQAGIIKTVKQPQTTLQGSPAIDINNFFRSSMVFKQLPDLLREVRELKAEIATLKTSIKS